MQSWQDELEALLIHASITGIKQSDLTKHFYQRGVLVAELTAYLEALRSEEKVQLFTMPPLGGTGRRARVWRATTLLAGE